MKIKYIIAAIIILCLAALSGFLFRPSQKLQGGLYTPVYQYTNFAQTNDSTSVGTLIQGYAGILHTVVFATPVVASVVVLYDSATTTIQIGTTTAMAKFTIPASPQPFSVLFDSSFANGLVVDQTAATSTLTITTQ